MPQSTRTIRELDVVALTKPQGGVPAGALGTVLEVFAQPQPAYLVEFADEQGREIATLTLSAQDLKAKPTA